ncbi:hypothetical protein H5410_057545 [Solanum commersonii]|uniref:Uncharacterized protein n=1 Tax=Solanum commersonii TaxID=4109 RepID=A0A9J5WN73_SOLCO|nr:hypothetical protein H5410_057545 [Solanum commersonii]
MDKEIQKLKTNEDNLKSKASQQHEYKNTELRTSKQISDSNQRYKKNVIPSFYANKRIIGISTIIQELANNYLSGAIWSYYARDH